jgi:phosphoribosylformylglycinamidine (FGAM) synthase PurS component
MPKSKSEHGKLPKPPRQTRKKGSSLSVKAEATAKLKASYKIQKNYTVTETIPADVTRAKASAWLDVFSPVRQWLGLKGDALRHQREALEIQRQETLQKISRRYTEIVKPGTEPGQIPPKFLIPFIEQASLEEPDSPLVELWASLIASAAEKYDGRFLHFSRIISGLSARQAEIFRAHFTASDLRMTERACDDIEAFLDKNRIISTLKYEIANQNAITDQEVNSVIENLLANPAISVVHVALDCENKYYDLELPYQQYKDADEVDFQILLSIGLIDRTSTGFIDMDRRSVSLTYYYITPLGFSFARACKIRPPG